MGVLGWIALGMAAALLANMALRQKITDASFQRPDLPRRSSGPAAGLPPAHQAIRPAGREHASPGHPRRITMKIVVVVVIALFLLGMALSARIVKQYEQGVLFRLSRVRGPRNPGFRLIVPFIDVLHRVSLRIVTMPIQSQGIITRDNVCVDVSAVAYFRRPGPGARPPRLPGSRVLGGHPAHGWTPVPRISTGRPGLSRTRSIQTPNGLW